MLMPVEAREVPRERPRNKPRAGGEPGSEALITRQVIEEHTPALLAFAQRMLLRPEDAQDALQETWISALKSAASFEGRSSLRTWLTGILRRRIFDRYHANRRLEPLLVEVAVEPPLGPEERDLRHAASQVGAALSEVTEMERTALVMCDVNDWDREEAAERIGITREHLRVVLHRARTKVERHLEGNGLGVELLRA